MLCVGDGNEWRPARTPDEFERVRAEVGESAPVRRLRDIAMHAADALVSGRSWPEVLSHGDLVIEEVPYEAAPLPSGPRAADPAASLGWDALKEMALSNVRQTSAHGECLHFALAVSELRGDVEHVAVLREGDLVHVATLDRESGFLIDARGAFGDESLLFEEYGPEETDETVRMDPAELRGLFRNMDDGSLLPLFRNDMADAFLLARAVLVEAGLAVPEPDEDEEFSDLVAFEFCAAREGRFRAPSRFDDAVLGRDETEWPEVAAHVKAGGLPPEPVAPCLNP